MNPSVQFSVEPMSRGLKAKGKIDSFVIDLKIYSPRFMLTADNITGGK
jgi:hypothetical protein